MDPVRLDALTSLPNEEEIEIITRRIYECVEENDIITLIDICKGKPYAYLASLIATREGKLNILTRLHDNNITIYNNIDSVAAYYGYIHILSWCLQLNILKKDTTLMSAVSNGKLDVLIWLKQQGMIGDEKLLLYSIFRGYHDITVWAISDGYEITEKVCRAVIMYGNGYSYRYIHDKARWYNWGCDEGICDICMFRSVINNMTESYLDWLPRHIIDELMS